MRTIAAFLAALLLSVAAHAQSAPQFTQKQVPSVAQWQGYFAGKVDTNGGSLSNGRVGASAIDNSPIGQVTPAPGSFSTLGATGPASLTGGGTLGGTYTGNPNFSGNPTGTAAGMSVTATGGTTARALGALFADTLNVKGYGAKGDTVDFWDGVASAGSSLLSSVSRSCSAADVGKSIILHGSGSSGAPQQGTITACSGNSFQTSFTTVQATPWTGAWGAAVVAGGTSYTAGDTLTAPGGTCAVQPTFTVTGTGAVTGLTVANPGRCASLPAGTISLTGGTGSGATATLNTTYQGGGWWQYGTDDSAAVVAATVAATSSRCVFFPAGGYWMVSQATSITLSNTCWRADPVSPSADPIGGATILVSNSSTNFATITSGGTSAVTINGMRFFYPMQDGYTTTPTTFPPLFEGTSVFDFEVLNSVFINPYQMFQVDTGGGGLGNVRWLNDRAYCVDKCFIMSNGVPEIWNFTDDFFSYGTYGAMASAGAANLAKYTAQNGEFIHNDTSGGSFPTSGADFTGNNIVFGMRYGIRVISGTWDGHTIGMRFDQVPTALSVEGSASILGTWAHNTFFSFVALIVGTTTDAFPTLNFHSNAQSGPFEIIGNSFRMARGSFIRDDTLSLKYLKVSGNFFSNWTKTTGSHDNTNAIHIPADSASLTVQVSDNFFQCSSPGGGALFSVALANNITGNEFTACAANFLAIGSAAGLHTVSGNFSDYSTGGSSLDDATSSTALVLDVGNAWDKPPTRRSPTVTCGAGATVSSASNNEHGVINVGTGGVTACTLTFTTALPYAPVSATANTDSTSIAVKITSLSTTAAVFGTSADISSGHIYYAVQQR